MKSINLKQEPWGVVNVGGRPKKKKQRTMWLEIIFGLVFYKLFRRFFYDDDVLDMEGSDYSVLFSVADRLKKIYGANVYVGLRIPDADTASRQSIDIVLLTKQELAVVSVKNYSGILTIGGDGSWLCEKPDKRKAERHPDPVEETRKQASILESYLEQRGVALPEGYICCKVILPNPKLCAIPVDGFPSEVITHDQWIQLKSEAKSKLSSWVKSAFRSGKKDMLESVNQNLDFVLSSAPIWDRVELKGNKYVLGDFLEFKGKREDVEALRHIRRSKVSRVVIQKTSMFGLGNLFGNKLWLCFSSCICLLNSDYDILNPRNVVKVVYSFMLKV
ncbi:hypothetical protein VIGAN_10236200 [Vigna angularis var. angularis]|uniref:NERD domain-containing protein n=1 Tax=Vigna angularis var. angularis TaxID=157739 RepID=A0A0S3T6A3_PHAAN|nr:hypothetical protein VIGAN_10236200 [Vigna angularis var. angularis]